MTKIPTFKYGPKDGSSVPDALWVLDRIELEQTLPDGRRIVYYYELNANSMDYIYQGQEG